MAIQITQDPINNFFDNLPRYALDLKQQDDTARFRDRQLSENIRQFNERQLQQQLQFEDTLDLSRDRLDFDIDKAMKTLDISQQNTNLTKRTVEMQEKLTDEAMEDRAYNRNRQFSNDALQDEIYKNLANQESDARIAARDIDDFQKDNSAVFVQADEYARKNSIY